MNSKLKTVDDHLKKYAEHHCTLIKKYRGSFHYVWVLDDRGARFHINVGKMLYYDGQIGGKYTIGRIGRKLISIRSGFRKFSEL